MKIIFSKWEFADMVRQCKRENCLSCALFPICEKQNNFDVSIVDLCEVRDDG